MGLDVRNIRGEHRLWSLWLVCFVCVVGALLLSQDAVASKTDLKSVYKEEKIDLISLTLGKGEVIKVSGTVSDVLIANPGIVNVQALKSSSLYAVGTEIGDTNIVILDDGGNILGKYDVHVSYDVVAIQKLVNDLFPDEDIEIGAIHDQIFMRGAVSTPLVASNVTSIVGHYVGDLQDQQKAPEELIANLLTVRGEQQVMLRVKVMEVKRTVLKELGVATGANNYVTDVTDGLGALSSPSGAVGSLGGGAFSFSQGTSATDAFTSEAFLDAMFTVDSGVDGIGIVDFVVDALEERNLVNILAEPNLTAVSGEEAGFLAGGEFPFPAGRGDDGELKIQFKQFGVSLNFRPYVMSEKRISLQLRTEVSALDDSSGLTLDGGYSVPGLDVRRAETTVEMTSGGSMMIAGLLKAENVRGISGIPGASSIPIIGDLLSSKSFEKDESEMVVLVTPYLVEPIKDKSTYEEEAESSSDEGYYKTDMLTESKHLSDNLAYNLKSVYGNRVPDLEDYNGQFGYLLN